MTRNEIFLKNVLSANALFSIGSAVAAVVAAGAIAASIGTSRAELYRLAVNLTIFAAFLSFLATRRPLRKSWILWSVLVVAIADVGWVAGTIASLATGLADATPLGRALIGVVGVVVGLFGVLELRAWHSVRRETRGVLPQKTQPSEA